MHPLVEIHGRFGLLTMGSSISSLPIFWLVKRKNKKSFERILGICLVLIVSFVILTAYNGGWMVYEYGVGVEEDH